MPGKIIFRVICRAQHPDIHLLQQRDCVKTFRFHLPAAYFPDPLRALRIQEFRDIKVTLQFKMTPVEKRTACKLRQNSCPDKEFLPCRGIAGDVLLIDSVCPHGAPFVMVCLEPELGEVAEAAVLRDIFRRKMVVVVIDRLDLRVFVIQGPGRFVLQQKVFIHEAHCPNLSFAIHKPSAGLGIK